jgi:FkbM family methyltransferase
MHLKKNKKLFVLLCLISSSVVVSAVVFSPVSYQDDMLLFVKSFLPEDPIILEAGGHYGEDTIKMKEVWPQATMYVFEPLPRSFDIMTQSTRHLFFVFSYPYALTKFSGVTDFYVNESNMGACSIGIPVSWNKNEFNEKPVQVQCTTINKWAQINNISRVDFMWLDMEGAELDALENGLDILKTVQAIYTEISFVPIRQGSCLYKDLKCFLEQQGFCEVWKSADCGRSGDALFVRQ